jgi:2-iminoacetate synthase ThiH
MRHAQRLGMPTTATMMYGHVETVPERVEHFRRIRELQDETHGFRSFTSWTFQSDGNRLSKIVPRESMPTSFDYLLTQAVSRIYLDNVDHIQSSWVTQGMKIGQVALRFGADDLGSVMIEENVVSAAGTTYRATTDDFVRVIRALGKTPVQRDTLYRIVRTASRRLLTGTVPGTKRPFTTSGAGRPVRPSSLAASGSRRSLRRAGAPAPDDAHAGRHRDRRAKSPYPRASAPR